MGRELFAYWRVAAAAAAQAEAAARDLQNGLRQRHPGLLTRLYRRADINGDSVTLMETYAWAGGDIDAALQAAIDARAATELAAWCQGGRHVEVFDSINP